MKIILFASLSILTRLIVIFLNRRHFRYGLFEVGDAAGHLIFIRQLKKDRNSKYIERYLIKDDAIISYPFLFHRLVSFFPKKIIEKRHIINSLLFVLACTLINCHLYFSNTYLDLKDHILFNLFFLTSISNTVFFGNNISYIDIGERFLSRVLVSFYYYFILFYLNTGSLNDLLPIIILVPLIFSVSKFARQAVLFPSLIIGIFYNELMLPFFLGIILVLLFDSKKIIYSIKHQIIHLYLYYKNFSKSFIVKNALSKYFTLHDFRDFLLNPSLSSFKKFFLKEPIRSIVFLPEFFLCVFIYLQNLHTSFIKPDVIILLSILSVYLLTSLKKLSFLGESYRYIEYSFYFLGPLMLVNSDIIVEYIYAIILYNLFFAFLYYLKINRLNPSKFRDDLKKMILDYSFTESIKVVTIPLRLVHGIILNTEAKGIWWQPESINKFVVEEILEQYPFPNKNLEFFIKRYGVNKIIFQKKYLKDLPWKYDFEKYKKEYENDSFIIYTTD